MRVESMGGERNKSYSIITLNTIQYFFDIVYPEKVPGSLVKEAVSPTKLKPLSKLLETFWSGSYNSETGFNYNIYRFMTRADNSRTAQWK